MKSVGLFIPVFLLIAASAGAQTLPERPTSQQLPSKSNALTICAGNVPPDNMVITATGNSPQCGGSCRARQAEPVEGPVMVICSGQPIPEYYEIESVTTTPACTCLNDEDNAYVIRRMREAPTPVPSPAPALPGSQVPQVGGTTARPAP